MRASFLSGVLRRFSLGFKSLTGALLASLFVSLAVVNLLGNLPMINIPTMYYFFTVSISLRL